MSVSDDYIVRGLRNHDDDAYRYLFEHHYSSLCAFAEMMVKDSYTAETIVGDLFCHIWEMNSRLDIKGDLRSYLVTAVRRRCINFLDQNFVRKEISGDFDEEMVTQESPTGQLLMRELDGKIKSAIDALPEKTRRVFKKSRFEGKTYAEISEELGISVNTVKYHMREALSNLTEALEGYIF